MTEGERYQVDRAVWLYTRLRAVIDAGERRKAQALTHRLTRWLATAPRRLVARYYSETCCLDYDALPEETKEKAAELARVRGERVLEMAREAEAAEAEEESADGDGT